jgi:phosphatidylinositol 4-kinase
MEDAVESVIVEEESKKLIKSKSIFQRFRNRSSSENNNGTDVKDSAIVANKMTSNDEERRNSLTDTSCSNTVPEEGPKDLPVNGMSPHESDSAVSSVSLNDEGSEETPKTNGVKENILNGIKELRGASSPQKNSSSCLLLRLFESKLFDMSIAMSYLFKSKESGVQAYLGNKLFVSICLLYRQAAKVLLTTCDMIQ